MKRDPSRKLDPETMLALAKTRKRQDRRAVSYLIAAAIMVLALGAIWWFFSPEEPARFTLAAYDAVATPNQSIALYSRVEPDSAHRSAKVNGLDLRFQIMATQQDETKATDPAGNAAIDWSAPKGNKPVVEFMVRHQSTENPRNAIRDQGRVFIWPADSKLLVIDVDHALTEGVEGLTGNTAPKLRSGAGDTLRQLSQKYRIIYVSTGANQPGSYKKLRSWLGQQVPPGPLLGPPTSLDPAEPETFTTGQIRQLSKQFGQPGVSVVCSLQDAQIARDSGWKAVVIGDVPVVPQGGSAVASWSELAKEL